MERVSEDKFAKGGLLDMDINQIEIAERLMSLETKMDFMISEIDEMKTNHIVHLKDDIKDLDNKFNHLKNSPSWIITTVLTLLSSLVVGLVVLILKS